MSAAYEHLMNAKEFQLIEEDVIMIEFLGVKVCLSIDFEWFLPLDLKIEFDTIAQTESAGIQFAYNGWFKPKWGRYFEAHPQDIKDVDGMTYVSMRLFDRIVITMLSKFFAAVSSWMDGEEDWKRHFEELIYVRCDPEFEKDDRIVKVGRTMNLYGRNANYKQHGEEGNPDTIFALFHVKFGSPAEKLIKQLFKKRCGKKPKLSKSGKKLKPEHFMLPTLEKDKDYENLIYELATTYRDEIGSEKVDLLLGEWWLRDFKPKEVKKERDEFVLQCMPWSKVSNH